MKAWRWKDEDGQRDDQWFSAAGGGAKARGAGTEQLITDFACQPEGYGL